jgi:hypothetical protein
VVFFILDYYSYNIETAEQLVQEWELPELQKLLDVKPKEEYHPNIYEHYLATRN